MHARPNAPEGDVRNDEMTKTRPKGVYAAPALEKAFQIIELLADYPDGALVSEMSAKLGRSVGELFRIVVVLEQLGYLRRSTRTDRYTVAYRMLDLAFRATPAQNLARVALPRMQILAMETDQSCHLVAPNDGRGLVIAREESPGTRGFALRLGAAIDMIQSCSGQVILAFSSPHRAERIIAAAQAERETAVDLQWLSGRLETVRVQGFDSRKSPITYGVTDISFPIFGFDGEVAGALTIPFLELIDGSQKMDLAGAQERLRTAATSISAALGHG